LSQETDKIDALIRAGAKRLLARATNARALDAGSISDRLSLVIDKYVLKNDPTPKPASIDSFLDCLHADDLCLVIACERGDQAAWNDLVEGYGPTVRSAARSATSNEELAEDLAQSIWAELHGLKARPDGTTAGKLTYYSGAGSLGGWLRAVVGQLAIDQHRRQSRFVQTEEDADMDRLAQDSDCEQEAHNLFHSSLNPEEALASELAAADVEKALAKTLSELAAEDRLLVKLYYFDGLRLREAGAVLGFHEATASRRLTRIHAEVRERVEQLLMREHGWTQSEARRSLAEIATHLQSEIEPMLTLRADSGAQSSPREG
jgi:RNA polymerase sigma-70 factor (ECF subfamily)